ARRIGELKRLISIDHLAAISRPYIAFDRRHTPGANWGRFSGMRTLNGNTLGIIGLGEIGREIAIRATAFGMKILYFQRSRLPASEERSLGASYSPLEPLLAESDVIIPQ